MVDRDGTPIRVGDRVEIVDQAGLMRNFEGDEFIVSNLIAGGQIKASHWIGSIYARRVRIVSHVGFARRLFSILMEIAHRAVSGRRS